MEKIKVDDTSFQNEVEKKPPESSNIWNLRTNAIAARKRSSENFVINASDFGREDIGNLSTVFGNNNSRIITSTTSATATTVSGYRLWGGECICSCPLLDDSTDNVAQNTTSTLPVSDDWSSSTADPMIDVDSQATGTIMNIDSEIYHETSTTEDAVMMAVSSETDDPKLYNEISTTEDELATEDLSSTDDSEVYNETSTTENTVVSCIIPFQLNMNKGNVGF